jgi:aldose 1-epimerase
MLHAVGVMTHGRGCASLAGMAIHTTRRPRTSTTRVAGMQAVGLHDDAADLHATWVPRAGMLGASLVHRGQELLWQGAGVAGYASAGRFAGIPFLHPWANRLAGFSYRAAGHEVVLDPASPSLLLDEHGLPTHGVLTASRDWRVTEVGSDDASARLAAMLEYDRPELLAAFPFPHRVEMTVVVGEAALEVRVALSATGDEPVPVAFGFHPYLQIPGIPRADWDVRLPVRRRLLLDERLIPTGTTEPAATITGRIGQRTWDDGFDSLGEPARFEVGAGGRTVAVEFADGYRVAQIFAPPGQEYVCIEPMTAPANALAGPDSVTAWVAPGGTHSATFRITPTG